MMGIIQRYAVAAISSNLRCDEHHHHTETLAAVALSSVLGAKLFRVKYSNDATSYQALLTDWHEIVRLKAIGRCWPEELSPSQIARLSLDYWLNDVCKICEGRGHLPIAHEPRVLSDDPCPACNGTAKRPIQAKNDVIKYVGEMVEALETMAIHAGGQALKQLSDEIDL